MTSQKLHFSVVIPVYNEAANIGNLLTSLLNQTLTTVTLEEIVVVASGCTDDTEAIVRRWQKKDRRLKLLTQTVRRGKTSALNLFLNHSTASLVALVGGDVVLKHHTLDRLTTHFQDKTVGMVGARIIPVNDKHSFWGFAHHTIWNLHDQVARRHPRLGEVTVWRRVFDQLPAATICDEATIETFILRAGLRLVYEPKAIAYNRGPEKFSEYLSRRRSIHLGHLQIQKQWNQPVVSVQTRLLLPYFLHQIFSDRRHLIWYGGVLVLELIARVSATIDYYWGKGKRQVVWPVAESAKLPITLKSKIRKVNASQSTW